MQKVSAVQYQTPNGGTVTVSYDRPEWLVDDNGTECRFDTVPEWMGHIRETYGWPLPSKAVD